MGVTGHAIIRDILSGGRDSDALALHRNGRVKASTEQVRRALTGNWCEEHLFLSQHALVIYDDLGCRVLACDAKIEAMLQPLARVDTPLSGTSKRRTKNNLAFDVREAMANWTGVGSLLRLCPGTKISGGKVQSAKTERSANLARQALKLAAMSLSRSDSALGAFYAGCALGWIGHAPIRSRPINWRAWCS